MCVRHRGLAGVRQATAKREAGELSHLAGTPAPRNSRRGSPGARPRPSAGLRRTENVGSQLLSLLQCPARGIVSAISGVVKKPKRRLRPPLGSNPRPGRHGLDTQGRRALPPDETVHGAQDSVPPGLANAGSGPAAAPLRRVEVGFNQGAARNALIRCVHGRAPLFVVRLSTFRHPTQTRQTVLTQARRRNACGFDRKTVSRPHRTLISTG